MLTLDTVCLCGKELQMLCYSSTLRHFDFALHVPQLKTKYFYILFNDLFLIKIMAIIFIFPFPTLFVIQADCCIFYT